MNQQLKTPTVFGHELTQHHKRQLDDMIKEVLFRYSEWLHVEGFVQKPHEPYKTRKWIKDGNEYDDFQLYTNFMSMNPDLKLIKQ